MDNSTILMLVIGIALLTFAVVAVSVAVWVVTQKKNSTHLKEKFGPEYDYTVNKVGGQKQAEAELKEREKRIEALDIRFLTPEEHQDFHNEWQKTQATFVDEPEQAVAEANQLIQEVMRTRGFPVANFEQRAADISVIYPEVVANYRAAHEIAKSNGQNGSDIRTENLRKAMVYYRSLFDELLHTETTAEMKMEEVMEKELTYDR